jgi:hypothetical protein
MDSQEERIMLQNTNNLDEGTLKTYRRRYKIDLPLKVPPPIGMYVNEKKKETEQHESLGVESKEVINYIQDSLTVNDVVQVVKKWLYIADEDVIHLVCAVAHSQRMEGDPVWLMLVAPPGSSNSEIINSLGDKPNEMVYPLSELTGASLASGHKSALDLLARFDENIVTVEDFTSLFTGRENERNRVFGILREAFDGYYKKQFGDEVVEKAYHLHTTIIGGVTNIIDEHKIFLASLEDRFLEIRIHNDEDEVAKKASQNEGKEQDMREELKLTMLSFLHQLKVVEVTIPGKKRKEIAMIAHFLSRMRTDVSRKRTRIVGYYPEPEARARLTKQLVKLTKALAQVRGRNEVNDEDITTMKCLAIDSCPEVRVRILSTLIEKHFSSYDILDNEKTRIDNPSSFEAIRLDSDSISKSISMNLAATNMHLEDMSMLQILDATKQQVDSLCQENTESEEEDETEPQNSITVSPQTAPLKNNKSKSAKKHSFIYKINKGFFVLFGQMMGEIIEWNYSITGTD